MKYKIESYWFGHVVVDDHGVAMSQAFSQLEDAEQYIKTLKEQT